MGKKGIRRSPETEFKKGKLPSGQPFKKGQTPWNKGIKGVYHASEKTRAKLSLVQIGHRPYNAVPKEERVCEGCGKEFMVGGRLGNLSKRFCSRECAGKNKPRPCEGKVFLHDAGYRMVRLNGKPYFEHRLIMEQILGRPLTKSEIVHHNNGDKLDNRKENLTVMSQACHRALVDHLANLWVAEHINDNGLVDKEAGTFQITFSSGG